MYRIRGLCKSTIAFPLVYEVSQVLKSHERASGPSLLKRWNAYSVSVERIPEIGRLKQYRPLEYGSTLGMSSKYILRFAKKTRRCLNMIREKVACIQKYLINSIDLLFFFCQGRVVATNDTRRGYGLQ